MQQPQPIGLHGIGHHSARGMAKSLNHNEIIIIIRACSVVIALYRVTVHYTGLGVPRTPTVCLGQEYSREIARGQN